MTQGVYERTEQNLTGLRQAASRRRKYPHIQIGDVFGSWAVLEKRSLKNGHQMWFCRCACGVEKETSETHLRRSASTKCLKCSGRLNVQRSIDKNFGKYDNNRRVEHVRLCVEMLYEYQKGICPLCGKQLPELSKCAWDHDHVSGEGRALLHRGCNVFLGFVERYPGILGRVLEYCGTYKIKTT